MNEGRNERVNELERVSSLDTSLWHRPNAVPPNKAASLRTGYSHRFMRSITVPDLPLPVGPNNMLLTFSSVEASQDARTDERSEGRKNE